MTTEEILEGNKLIAEFMKLDYSDAPSDGTCNSDESYLKYHYDWNWLMPVVEKIENTIVDNIELSTQIEGSSCVVLGTHIFCESDTKIEATWLAVVKFIKWYNQNR